MGCKLIQVIECTELRHGSGASHASPVRIVTQYFSTDGVLLAQVDPCSKTVSIEDDPKQQEESRQTFYGDLQKMLREDDGSPSGGDPR